MKAGLVLDLQCRGALYRITLDAAWSMWPNGSERPMSGVLNVYQLLMQYAVHETTEMCVEKVWLL